MTWCYSGPSAEGHLGDGAGPVVTLAAAGWFVQVGTKGTPLRSKGHASNRDACTWAEEAFGAPVSAVSSSPVVMPKVLYVPREQVRKP